MINNPDNNPEINPLVANEIVEEDKVVLTDFQKLPKRYILCLDTLGKDRVFTAEEHSFALETAKIFRDSWEELEKKLLIKDRDIRIEMIKNEKIYSEIVNNNFKNYRILLIRCLNLKINSLKNI